MALWASLLFAVAPDRVVDDLILLGRPDAAVQVEAGPSVRVRALVAHGETQKAVELLAVVDEADRTAAVETICWGTIKEAFESDRLRQRAIAILMAAEIADSRGMPIVLQGLNDSNIVVRGVAAKVSAGGLDAPIIARLREIAASDPIMDIRLTALSSLANGQVHDTENLIRCFVNGEESDSNTITGQQLLLMLRDDITDAQLDALVRSPRAKARFLACLVVQALGRAELVAQVIPLVEDTHPVVAQSAMSVLVVYRDGSASQQLRKRLQQREETIAITAAWALASMGDNQGVEYLKQALQAPDSRHRSMAACALARVDQIEALEERLKFEKDLYVRLNIGEGLLRAGRGQKEISKALQETSGLLMRSDRWSVALPIIEASDRCKSGPIPEAEMEDLQIRLELLKKLCVTGDKSAIDALLQFCCDPRLDKTFGASFVLLQEGSEAVQDAVSNLLTHSERKVRLQAAVLLGRLFSDERATAVLQEEFESCDFETQGIILESLGRIGAKDNLPFLEKQLASPSPFLRQIAAWAVLSTLNH